MVIKIVLMIIVIIAAVIFVVSYNNSRTMKECYSSAEEMIRKSHALKELDPGEFKTISVYGLMKFHVKQYSLEGIGNVSAMMLHFGPMQMMTLVITPIVKDVPLMSADYIYMAGTRKVYIEFYELPRRNSVSTANERLNKLVDRYSSLTDIKMGDTWYRDLLIATAYKTAASNKDDEIKKLLADAVEEYLDICDSEELMNDEGQRKKAQALSGYYNDLILKGGISTDVFKKQLGEEKTREFFEKVFFGTECSMVK